MPGQPSENEIRAALREFSRTLSVQFYSEVEALRVLERQRHILLSDAAFALIPHLIADAYQSHDTDQALDLRSILELLRDAVKRGIPAAWQHFVSDEAGVAARAITELVGAWSLKEKERVLQTYSSLVFADKFIDSLLPLIATDRLEGRAERAHFLELHYRLLLEARSIGIPAALQNFDRYMDMEMSADDREVLDKVEAFAEAPDLEKTWSALVEHQQVLLSDHVIEVLAHSIEYSIAEGDWLRVQRYQQRLSLLKDALARGIGPAWDHYVNTYY